MGTEEHPNLDAAIRDRECAKRTPEYPYGTQIAADEGLSGQKSANLSGHDLGPLWGIKKGQKLSGLLIWVPNSRIFFLTTQGIAKITQFLVFYCLVL